MSPYLSLIEAHLVETNPNILCLEMSASLPAIRPKIVFMFGPYLQVPIQQAPKRRKHQPPQSCKETCLKRQVTEFERYDWSRTTCEKNLAYQPAKNKTEIRGFSTQQKLVGGFNPYEKY